MKLIPHWLRYLFTRRSPTSPPGDYSEANAELIAIAQQYEIVANLWRQEAREAAAAGQHTRAREARAIANTATYLRSGITNFYRRWQIRD